MDNRLRPRYHFTPPANWMNDPNGLIHWQGNYHLFYQYNPNGAFWGTMHWGHAMSPDLIHWTNMPVALAPDPDGPDRDGCFSGVAVNVGDGVTLVYTGVEGDCQLPCLAMSSDDDLATWTKYEGNPVIAAAPNDPHTTIFRDHSVWKDNDAWYQVIGSGIEGVGGAALLYRSPDLIDWEYLGPLLVENPAEIAPEWKTTGWECPDFFPLGNRHVLTLSLWDEHPIAVGYYAGMYAGHRFVPDRHGSIDGGGSFYAPQSFTDDGGRRIMFGWLREECPAEMQLAHGWSGAMSLPRLLSMTDDDHLRQTPAPEIESLRGKHLHLDWQPVDWFRHVDLNGIRASSMEISAEFAWDAKALVAFNICGAGSEEERTNILLSVEDNDLRLDTTRSSGSPGVSGGNHGMTVNVEPGEAIRLRIFVDVSIVEIFLNDRYCLSSRIYPADETGMRLHISSTVPGSIDIWELASAS